MKKILALILIISGCSQDKSPESINLECDMNRDFTYTSTKLASSTVNNPPYRIFVLIDFKNDDIHYFNSGSATLHHNNIEITEDTYFATNKSESLTSGGYKSADISINRLTLDIKKISNLDSGGKFVSEGTCKLLALQI